MPPNAKELETTTFSSCGRDRLGTMSRGSSRVSSTLTVGGSTPSRSAITQVAASMAPAAPSIWPTCDLVLLIGAAVRPANRASTALVSALSLVGVPVPWPLT